MSNMTSSPSPMAKKSKKGVYGRGLKQQGPPAMMSGSFSLLSPEWIGILSSLEVFNLWGNKLENLPNSIASLSSLKILDLNFNKFEELPPLLKELERKNGLIIKF